MLVTKPRKNSQTREDEDESADLPDSAQTQNSDSDVPQEGVEGKDYPDDPESSPEDANSITETEVEAPVPAIPPPSQPPKPTLSSPNRPPKRPTQEIATITIGDHTVTSIIGSSAKRPRIQETSAASSAPKTTTGPGKRLVPLPSFGNRLTQMFSASASTQKTSNQLEVTTKHVEMSMDDKDEEEADEDGEDDEVQDDDDLFITQRRDAGISDDEEKVDDGDRSSNPDKSGSDDDMEFPDNDVDDSRGQEGQEDLDQSHGVDTPIYSRKRSASPCAENEDSDYVDEDEKKAKEDQKVQEMIKAAEVVASGPSEETEKRSQMLLKGGKKKNSTVNMVQQLKVDERLLLSSMSNLSKRPPRQGVESSRDGAQSGIDAKDAEEKLALKISKSDFDRMKIIGQFNLGFIIAIREADRSDTSQAGHQDDELFIIDQHASDEKFNFERLQANTVVQSQRLVQPKTLELTAMEEEIIMENLSALEANGFVVQVDNSGEQPVGSRCQLMSLPLSRETTFSVADLEELVFLLGDNPTSSATTVPRPSKVRKMFAMRACRSSVMIGTALSKRQMERVVRHMGGMEKPWNCPHGRPTMRHLCGLGGSWDGRTWEESDGFEGRSAKVRLATWIRERREEQEL